MPHSKYAPPYAAVGNRLKCAYTTPFKPAKIVGLAVQLAGALFAAAAFAPLACAQNTWQKPFAGNSIWNTPIGNNPSYVPCNLGTLGAMANDREWLIQTKGSDPHRVVQRPEGGGHDVGVNLPDSFVMPVEPNDGKAFLLPGGVIVREYVAWRPKAGTDPTGWFFGDHPLNGDGIVGGHGGSSMSALGGSLRIGEMESEIPIGHTLKLELDWAVLYHSATDRTNQSQTYRWPASRSDGNFGGYGPGPRDGSGRTYGGSNSALKMGSLVAIPHSVNIKGLGLSANGLKIAEALQTYGAYIVDTTGDYWQWGNGGYTSSLCVQHGACETYFRPNNHYINNDQFYTDMCKIYPLLNVVNDNTVTSIGGAK